MTPSLPEAAKLAQRALRGVIRVADRATDEFDLAHEALADLDAALSASPEPTEPVYWESRTWYGENTVRPGWGDWERVEPRNAYTSTVADRVAEIQHYIDTGYKYELRALYTTPPAQAEPSAQEPVGLSLKQEPKYTVNGSAIVNRASGEAIPADEPVFIFRARDVRALYALTTYRSTLPYQGAHLEAVTQRIKDFTAFALAHPERMKEPDTATLTPQTNPMSEALAAGDDTLHGAIDYWQKRASAAESASASVAAAVQAPAEGAQKWPASWLREGYNGALVVAAEALRYLADNDRPSGGSSSFNSEHLFQLARELDKSREVLLSATPQPQPPSPEQAQAKQDVQAVPEGFVLVPRELDGDRLHDAWRAAAGKLDHAALRHVYATTIASPSPGAAPPVQGELLTPAQMNTIWREWTDKHPQSDWRALVNLTQAAIRNQGAKS